MTKRELRAIRKAVEDAGGIISFDESGSFIGSFTVILPHSIKTEAAEDALIDPH